MSLQAKELETGDLAIISGQAHTVLSVENTPQPGNPAVIAIVTPEPEVIGTVRSFGGGTPVEKVEK